MVSLCRSLRHCSQKYSSGLIATSIIPTQPPCCQTLHTSHWINRPPVSSCRAPDSPEPLILWLPLVGPGSTGIPGYSRLPHMHRVTSSSPSSSSSSSSGSIASGFTSSWLLVLRECGFAAPSTTSEESDLSATELRGEVVFCMERALRSARPEETEEVEELDCCCGEGLGFEVARNDRREDMLVRECYRGAIMLKSEEKATVNAAMRLPLAMHLCNQTNCRFECGGNISSRRSQDSGRW